MRDHARAGYLLVNTAFATSLLCACGGGSGNTVASIPAPPPVQATPSSALPSPPPPTTSAPPAPPTAGLDTQEYRRSNGAAAHDAIKAYELGATGKGVTVALFDTGINGNLPFFNGRVDSASRDIVWGNTQYDRGVTDSVGHGSAVASILAGARDDTLTHGVAYGSKILSLNTATCDVWGNCRHLHSDLRKALDIAVESGARVVNMSLGGDSMDADLLAAIDRATRAGLVIVVSAGNQGEASPSNFALDAASRAGNGNVIIVGAMTADRQLAGFSNAAGVGADQFLVALGAGINAHDQYGREGVYNGTSYSAPVVSGAAALLASAFPNLTGRQIVEILLGTADDAGAPGADHLFGQGILNIARAFAPQGQVKLAGTASAAVPNRAPTGSPAMGNAWATPADAVVLDRYDRAYKVALPAGVTAAPVSRPLAPLGQAGTYRSADVAAGPVAVSVTSFRDARPENAADPMRIGAEDAGRARIVAGVALSRLTPQTKVALGISESGATLQRRLSDASGAAFLVARDIAAQPGFQTAPGTSAGVRHALGRSAGLTLTHEMGEALDMERAGFADRRGYRVSSVTFDRRLGAHGLSLGLSRMEEDSTLLGGTFSAAFYSGKATSYFVDAAADLRFGNGWTSGLAWRSGMTAAPVSGGLVDSGRLWTNAFSFDIGKAGAFGAGDRLALRISQPLRVASGGFGMNVPTSYDYETRTVGYSRQMFNLAPRGREIDYELSYAAPLFAGSIAANAYLRTDPGHVEERRQDIGAVFRFSSAF